MLSVVGSSLATMNPFGAEQLRCVERHVDEDDMDGLANELVRIIGLTADTWQRERAEILGIVRTLPYDSRLRLADAWAARQGAGRDDRYISGDLVTLVGIVSEGLPDEMLSAVRLRRLEEFSHHSVVFGHQLYDIAQAELAAGRPLPGPVVAVIRRTGRERRLNEQSYDELAAGLTDPVLNPGEAWADQALAELPALGGDWTALLAHTLTMTASKPSAAWDRTARRLIDAIGSEAIRTTLLPWLALVGRPRTLHLVDGPGPGTDAVYDPYNADALRGLAWLLALLPAHRDSARALGRLTEASLRKVPGVGPRNPKIANAAVTALARIEGEAALAELARLDARVTFKGTGKLIGAALDAKAVSLGMSRDEVEELAVPAYGLAEVGRRTHRLGECTVELTVTGGRPSLSWLNAAGKRLKSPPAAVKQGHADELKELKAAAKDIDRMLAAQSARLDLQFLARRTWTYAAWRERYLDHPLVGTLARRLLWTVDGAAYGFADGELRGPADEPVMAGLDTDATTVELWHPSGRAAEEVAAWRDWLERHGTAQPFKQVHRETYPLTDAERQAVTYSDRFAGLLLRQHQFHALAALRGWTNRLRVHEDTEHPPAYRELPKWGLRAEFWVEGDGDHNDTVESGTSFLRLVTDQVRFYPLDAPLNSAHARRGAGGNGYRMWLREGQAAVDPLPLADVPERVISEVLRDVDLFVSAARVGNDEA